jgi:hypothetical protein
VRRRRSKTTRRWRRSANRRCRPHPPLRHLARRAVDEHAQRLLTKAEREFADQSALERGRSNYRQSFVRRWLGILLDTGVLSRGILLGIGLFLVLTLVAQLVFLLAEGGPQVMFAIVTLVFLAMSGSLLTLFLCKFCVVLLENSAEGNARVEDWSDDMFMDFVGQTMYVMTALLASALPGVVLTMVSRAVMPGEAWSLIWLAASVCVCFPVVLMSSLEGGHPLQLVSMPVMQSIGQAPRYWVRFYLQTVLLAGLTGLLLVLIPWWQSWTARVPVTAGLLALIVLYFRALGLVAADASLAMSRRARDEEQSAAERDA